jgi:TPR repeat protein
MMALCVGLLASGEASRAADDVSSQQQGTNAVRPDPAIATLLHQAEDDIVAGHSISPQGDNALDIWVRVTAAPISPGGVRAIADFAADLRNRADLEKTAGRTGISKELVVMLARANDWLTHAKAVSASREAAARQVPHSVTSSGGRVVSPATDTATGIVPPAGSLARAATEPAQGTSAAQPATHAPTSPDQSMAELYAKRGDAMLAIKDISAARKFYEYAADAGSARAATAIAKTYDPTFLSQWQTVGLEPDPALAASWYRKAAALGDPKAVALLGTMGAAAAR